MAKLFANSGDPQQTLGSVVSDLGLHCLPVTLLRVFRLQWDNLISFIDRLCASVSILCSGKFV